MRTIDQILRDGDERRLAEKNRRDAIELFRRTTERSLPDAFLHLTLALFSGAFALFWAYPHRAQVSGDVLAVIVSSGVTLFCLYTAVQRLWVSPIDKILLFLVEELLVERKPTRDNEMVQSGLATPAAPFHSVQGPDKESR